jgi:hypothetical protein
MTEQLRRAPMVHPAAWRRVDLEADQSWIWPLDDGDRAEILEALSTLEASGASVLNLPRLGARLDAIIDEIEGGRGVALIRGIPVKGAPLADIERLFMGLAAHIGYPEAQDAGGKLLHRVCAERAFSDRGEAQAAFRNSDIRAYQTNVELGFHGDGSDALFFLCVRQGRSGGATRLCSSVTAFNDLLARDAALTDALQSPFAFDTRGQTPGRPYQELPIYAFYDDNLSMLYKRGYIELAQLTKGAPKLTAKQIEALDALDAVLEDDRNCFSFMLKPGDLLIANNYNILHARTSFEDWSDPEQSRLMFRVWATLRRNRRRLPPLYRESREFAETYKRRVALGDPD